MHDIKNLNPPRRLSSREKETLSFLLSNDFPGREELSVQFEVATVSSECNQCPTVEFAVPRESARPASVKARVPIEAESLDVDGEKIHILLHVVGGFLAELEFFREDGQSIRAIPEIESLTPVNYQYGVNENGPRTM